MSLNSNFSCAKEKESITDETVLGLLKDNVSTCEGLSNTCESLNDDLLSLFKRNVETCERLNETSLKVLELKHRLNKAEAENKKLKRFMKRQHKLNKNKNKNKLKSHDRKAPTVVEQEHQDSEVNVLVSLDQNKSDENNKNSECDKNCFDDW
jgi:hypothetical protein